MIVLEKYKLIEEVAKGGMGLVYRAEDQKLGRIVAIKELILPKNVKEYEKELLIERFKREAKVGSSLTHPNIVKFFDYGQENDRYFIAMEFLKGDNLKDFLINKYLNKEQLLQIFLQIAQGLDFAHNNKIIHRDIKPANIQVLPNNKIKITDFGIAKVKDTESDLTQDGSMFGTLGYISPEQIMNSKTVDHRSDIYSFGALMYEVIASQPLFNSENIGELVYKIFNSAPNSLSQIRPEIPEKVEAIIFKCLEKDPDRRYQNSIEIVNDLKGEINNDLSNKIVVKNTRLQNSETLKINVTNTKKIDADKTISLLVENGFIEMTRGQKIIIKDYIESKRFTIGVNWTYKTKPVNIDLSVMLLSENEKLEKDENFIFYNNLISPCLSVIIDQSENNLYKNIIDINLNNLPPDITRLKILINTDESKLTDLENIELSLISTKDKSLLYKINDFTLGKIGVIADIYKYKNEWKMQATGEGYDIDLESFLRGFASEQVEIISN